MYKGKRYRRRKKQKPALLLVSLIMVLTVTVGGTLAYLVATTGNVQNTFTVEQVPIAVLEDFNGTTKSNVRIKHTGEAETGRDAYVRATVVANWVSDENNKAVHNQMPAVDTDYTLVLNTDTVVANGDYWKKIGDYWYYMKPLAPGDFTPNLINSCTAKDTAPEGYHLSVEILAQSIQADGEDSEGKAPVELAWKDVTRNANRTLSVN